MKKNKLLKTLINGWDERIKTLGLTKKRFCEKADISYSTFLQLKNPSITLLDKIETKLSKMEGKK